MRKKRIVAIILARMGSTRLPGKVLMDICGRPMLGHIIDRLKSVKLIDEIVLATTSRPSDRVLLDFAKKERIKGFAYDGDPEDVVARLRRAGEEFAADVMVNVNGDCPLIHPPLIERLLETILKHDVETVRIAKLNGRKVIHGGVGVFTLNGWRKVDENSTEPYQRQNTTACLLDCPDLLKKVEIEDEPIFYELNHRIWVDTCADLEFVRAICRRLNYKPGKVIDLREVINLLKKEPGLMEINSRVRQKRMQDKSRKIIFRVDAGREIGMGHLVRCLALATELQERYFCGAGFVIKNEDGVQEIIRERGFKVEVLPSDISREDEAGEVLKLAQNYGADRIVLDLKEKLSVDYIKRLKQIKIPLISIDNDGPGALLADVNIFPVMHFVPDKRWADYKGKLYYGPEYVILRRQFLKDYPCPDNKVPDILITMGAGDTENLTGKVLSAILPIPDIHITVVLGKFFAHYEKIKKMIAGRDNITVYQDVKNMAEVMAKADLAITYFGITAYELAKMGIPTMVIAHSKEDEINVEELAKLDVYVGLGYYEDVDERSIYSAASNLLCSKKLRDRMSLRGKQLFDGKGSERVTRIIIDT